MRIGKLTQRQRQHSLRRPCRDLVARGVSYHDDLGAGIAQCRDLARGDETRFRDPESGKAVTLAPSDWGDAYRETVRGVVRAWGTACRAAGVRYALVPTDLPFGPALQRALSA